MEYYDVVIIGGGPSGATLARLLNKDLKILLVDYNNGKPCGGLLAPDAQRVLARLNITLPKEIIVDPQIFSVRTMDLETKKQRWYQRMYINIDRNKFDEWLLNMVADNVTVIKGRCVDIQNKTVYIKSGDEIKIATGGIIVGADGANSIVRRKCFKPIKTRVYTAVQQWFLEDETDSTPFYSCIFDRETTDCCAWTISKDGYLIYGGAFPKANSRERFERQKEKLKAFDINLKDAVKTESCVVLRPKTKRSFELGGGNIFLIGEAAGFISPSSLEGISSAFNSAIALSKSINNGGRILREYKKRTIKLRMWLIMKNLKCPFMYNFYLRKLIMATGIDSIKLL